MYVVVQRFSMSYDGEVETIFQMKEPTYGNIGNPTPSPSISLPIDELQIIPHLFIKVIKYFSGCSKFLKSNIVPSNFLDNWAFADLLMGTTSNFLEVMKMEEFLKLTLAL